MVYGGGRGECVVSSNVTLEFEPGLVVLVDFSAPPPPTFPAILPRGEMEGKNDCSLLPSDPRDNLVPLGDSNTMGNDG